MVPNAKVPMALGFAFVAGVSTTMLVTAGRSLTSVRSATASESPVEPGSASSAWEDPTRAKPAAALPARFAPRDDVRRAGAVAYASPLSSPPARPMDDALRANGTVAAVRHTRPPMASNRDGLPDHVTPPVRRRTLAEAYALDGAASKRVHPVADAPVRRPVERLAGNFQGQGAIRSARGGDGLLRWLSE